MHTAESTCYGERGATAEDIVDAATATGLDAIAITDHNTTAALDKVRSAARRRDLFVFPGVEISTSAGHVLGIFDLDTAASVIDGVLERLGIAPDGRGDGTRTANGGMDRAFQTIVEAGGIAVAAHVDRWPSGLFHASASLRDRLRLLNSEYLSALEITVPSNRHLWNAGQIPDFSRKLACVQGSDAHAPHEIGRRRVHIAMITVSLASLREAFANCSTAIVFPDQQRLDCS